VSDIDRKRVDFCHVQKTHPTCPASPSTLDLSFNNVRHVPNLPSQRHISTLYLVQNKIAEVEPGELDWAADSMKSLELGGNRLRVSGNDRLSERPRTDVRDLNYLENRKLGEVGPLGRTLVREKQDPSSRGG
jgi:hypothetical protein